jgi:hypothetical protein
MADSPAVTKATATTKPATGTGFATVMNSIASVAASLVPTITGVAQAKYGTTPQISPYSSNPQIIQVPATQQSMDYTPLLIAGGVGILALGGLAILTGSRRSHE